MPIKFPKQMWNVRVTGHWNPDLVFHEERLRSMSRPSALRQAKKHYGSAPSFHWEALPVQGPELPRSLEEHRLREKARQEEAERRNALIQMRSAPGPWKFELSDNEAAAMRGMGEDTYWRFNAPTWRDGMEAMAVYGSAQAPRVGDPFSVEEGFRRALADEDGDFASMTDDELEDYVANIDGTGGWPTLLRLTGPDKRVYPRFDTNPRDYWDPEEPPASGFRPRAIRGIKFRSR